MANDPKYKNNKRQGLPFFELNVRNVMVFAEFKYIFRFLRYDNFCARVLVDIAVPPRKYRTFADFHGVLILISRNTEYIQL